MAVPLHNTGHAMATLLSSQATLCRNSRTSPALDKQAMSSVFLSSIRMLRVHSFEVSKLIPELLCKKERGRGKKTLLRMSEQTDSPRLAHPLCPH